MAGVFVTVGTTKFDGLIQAVDSLAVAEELASRGYQSLVVQKGAGAYVPQNIVARGAQDAVLPCGLSVQIFDFAPNLDLHMRRADLVISHAGSGSLFEALRLRKAIIAVPNAILMDNHQAELAEHLEGLDYCWSATPETLLETLQRFDESKLKPYEPGNPRAVAAAIESMMGM